MSSSTTEIGRDDVDDPLEPPGARWSRAAGNLLAPFAALVVTLVFMCVRAGYGVRQAFEFSSWGRWDTGWYRHIADDFGYETRWCQPQNMPTGKYLCGTTGWYPGYPFAARLVHDVIGGSTYTALMIVAWICWYLMLLVMWVLLADARTTATRWLCLFAAALVPGQVYFSALFPVSMCAAAMLAAVYFVVRSPARAAGLFGFGCAVVAGYTYFTGLMLAPALAFTGLVLLDGARRRRALMVAGGAVIGFLAMEVTMWHDVRIWNAYFLSTKKYGVGANNPFVYLRDRIRLLTEHLPHRVDYVKTEVAQTIITLGLVLFCVAVTTVRMRGRASSEAPGRLLLGRPARWLAARISAFDASMLVLLLIVTLVPYIAGGHASTYRSEAFSVMGIPLLRRLRWPWLVAVLVVESVIAARMVPLFVNKSLV